MKSLQHDNASPLANPVISGLLKSLDSFKVLMCRSIQELIPIEASLTSCPNIKSSALTLEFQSCPVEKIYAHIPWPRSEISFLVEALTVSKGKTKVVLVLDLLTTLCILLGGEIEEKAKLLFKWYNLNQQGLMEEDEHYLLIRRIGLCLKKLRILGNLDLTDAEARFFAIQARVVPSSHFLPGLTLADFTSWIQNSAECKVYFSFIHVFNRLVDMLVTLDRYAQAAHSVSAHQDALPRIVGTVHQSTNHLGVRRCTGVRVLSRSSQGVVLGLFDELASHTSRSHTDAHTPVLVEVWKEVEAPAPFYEIADNIKERQGGEDSNLSEHTTVPPYTRWQRTEPCCARYYTVRDTHAVRIGIYSPHQAIHRVVVPQLEVGTYTLQVVGGSTRYAKVKVQIHDTEVPIQLIPKHLHVHAPAKTGVCMLPSVVDANALDVVLSKHQQKNKQYVYIYTGVICDLSEALKGIPHGVSALQPIADPLVFQSLCDKVVHAIHLHHSRHFARCVSEMLEKVCLVKDEYVDDGTSMCFAQSHTQLLFYPGIGVPVHHTVLRLYQDILHPKFFPSFLCLVEKTCMDQYAGVWPTLIPSAWCMRFYSHQVYPVSPYRSMCNVLTLIDVFAKKVMDDMHMHEDRDDITLLVRSVEDLMYLHDDTVRNAQSPSLAMFTPPQTYSATTTASLDATVAPEEMRGKYEILHGEYRNNLPQAQTHVHAQAMPAFTKLVEVLFSYLIMYTQQTQRSKEIHITSCVCASGVGNFVLKYTHNEATYTIVHDNLVQPDSETLVRSHSQGNPYPYAPLLTPAANTSVLAYAQSVYTNPLEVLKGLLPAQVVFIETPNSPTHATFLHHRAGDTPDAQAPAPSSSHVHIQTPSQTHTYTHLDRLLPQTHSNAQVANSPNTMYAPVNIHRAHIHTTTSDSCVVHVHTTGLGLVYVHVYDLPTPYTDEEFAVAMQKKAVSGKFRMREKKVLYVTYMQNVHEVSIVHLSPFSRYGVYVYVQADLNPSPAEELNVVKGLKRADSNTSNSSSTSNKSNKSNKGTTSEARGVCLTFTTNPDTTHIFSTLLVPSSWKDLLVCQAPSRVQKVQQLVRTLHISNLYVMYRDGEGEYAHEMCMDREDVEVGYIDLLKLVCEANHVLPTSFSIRTNHTEGCREELVSMLDIQAPPDTPVLVPLPKVAQTNPNDYVGLSAPSHVSTYIPPPQVHVPCMVKHGVYVKQQGNYMVLCPKYTNHSSIHDLEMFIRSLHTHYPQISSLIVMAGRLLIPASSLNMRTQIRTRIGMTHTHAHVYIQLFEAILQWQKGGEVDTHGHMRKSIILGAGHVKRVVSVNVGHHYINAGNTVGDGLQQPSFVTSTSLPSQLPDVHASQTLLSSSSKNAPLPTSQAQSPTNPSSSLQLQSPSKSPLPSPQKLVDELPSLSLYGSSANHNSHVLNADDIWTGHLHTIRYFIFPRQKDIQSFDVDESVSNKYASAQDEIIWEFDSSLVNIHDDLYYQVYVCDTDAVLHKQHVSFTPAHTRWYGEGLDMPEDSREVFYRIDILHHPDVYVSSPNGIVQGPQMYWIHVQEILHEYDVFHVTCGPVVGLTTQTETRVLFEVSHATRELTCTLIPSDTADDDTTHIHRTLYNLEAYTPRVFHFTNLSPNMKYTIALPQVSKLTSLGVVRTLPKFSSSLSVIVIGGGEYSHLPIVEDVRFHLNCYQSLHKRHLHLLNQFVYEENRDYNLNVNPNSSQVEAQPSVSDTSQSQLKRLPSLSTLLLAHTKLPGCSPLAIFHLAPQTILSSLWLTCSDRIIEQCERYLHYDKVRCELAEFYYKQCEQVVKDTIRILWTQPSVQGIFNSYANFFLYHSHYYLSKTPRTSLPPRLREDGQVREVIQEIFTAQVYKYVAALYHSKDKVKDYFSIWKLGALCICMLDIVSGREREEARKKERRMLASASEESKSKKEGDDVEVHVEEDDDEESKDVDDAKEKKEGEVKPTVSAPSPVAPPEEEGEEEWVGGFSRNFLDKGQWKSLRASCSDDTTYQLVILMEKPLIALDTDLTSVNTGTNTSTSASAGAPSTTNSTNEESEFMWQPTATDLTTFLAFFIEWIATVRRKTKNAESRSVLLISSYPIPYITVFQDLKTGIKIHQMCVGDYSLGKKVEGLDPASFILSGKLGSIRYAHKLSDTSNFLAESVASDAIRLAADAVNPSEILQGIMKENNGYAELKLLLDTWKPTGLWSNVNVDAVENSFYMDTASKQRPEEKLEEKPQPPKIEAMLLVGPIPGAPYCSEPFVADEDLRTAENKVECEAKIALSKKEVFVPVLIETDNDTPLTITIHGLFNKYNQAIQIANIPGRKPYVFTLGPLPVEERYHVILSGLRLSPFNSFYVTTSVHLNETNMAVINCQTSPDALSASVLMTDLRARCALPFGGINAVVHTHFQPSMQKVIDEVQFNKVLEQGFLAYYQSKVVLPKFRQELETVIESLREIWRDILSKPSYRELLRSTFNIFVPTCANPDQVITPEREKSYKVPKCARFLQMVCSYIEQEYIDQLRYPSDRIHRCVFSAPNDGVERQNDHELDKVKKDQRTDTQLFLEAIYADEDVYEGDKVRRKVMWVSSEGDWMENMLKLWSIGCHAADNKFCPYVSMNFRMSLEVIPMVHKLNINRVERQLERFDRVVNCLRNNHVDTPSPLKPATDEEDSPIVPADEANREHALVPCARIIIFDRENESEILATSPNALMSRLWSVVQKWQSSSLNGEESHRQVRYILPCTSQGSKVINISLTAPNAPVPPTPAVGTPAPAPPPFTVYLLDTIYRSCEFERRQIMSEREKARPRKVITAAQGKTKRAQKKREEEERAWREMVQREMQEVWAAQVPDGYILLRGLTKGVKVKVTVVTAVPAPPAENPLPDVADTKEYASGEGLKEEKEREEKDKKEENEEKSGGIEAEPASKEVKEGEELPPPPPPTELKITEEDVVDIHTQVAVTYMGDVELLNYLNTLSDTPLPLPPALTKLIQLPYWLEAYCPPSVSLFCVDEVVLLCKHQSKTRAFLHDLETQALLGKIEEVYRKSRLFELSLPEHLREVGWEEEGVLNAFFKEAISRVWQDVLTKNQRSLLFFLPDDFIRSFTYTYTSTTIMDQFSTPRKFASCVNIMLKNLLFLHVAYTMKDTKRYSYLLFEPNEGLRNVRQLGEKDRREERALLVKRGAARARFIAMEKLTRMTEEMEEKKNGGKKNKKKGAKGKGEVEPIKEEFKEEDIVLSEEELQELRAQDTYDSDLDDIHKEVSGARPYTLPKKDTPTAPMEEKPADKESGAKKPSRAPREPDPEGDNSQLSAEEIDENNQEALSQLLKDRVMWLTQTMDIVFDSILESELNEALDRSYELWLVELSRTGVKSTTEQEKRGRGAKYLERLKVEEDKARSMWGDRFMKFA